MNWVTEIIFRMSSNTFAYVCIFDKKIHCKIVEISPQLKFIIMDVNKDGRCNKKI